MGKDAGKGRIQSSAEGRASGLLPSGASRALGHPGACELLAAEGCSWRRRRGLWK